MKKGSNFPEIMISLLIISVAIIIFLKISTDYIRTLVFAKEMFLLNSALHEKYQLVIAYRNKVLEKGTSSIEIQPGNYCFNFDTSSLKIVVSSGSSCPYYFLKGNSPNINYSLTIQPKGDLYHTQIKSSSSLPYFLELNLEAFLSKWVF